MKKNLRQQKGFTLVEILVVLGLFSGISTLVLGSLFNAQAINNRLQETQSILDNVNLSAQTIARDIRFGSEFHASVAVPVPQAVTNRKNCVYKKTDIPALPCTILYFKSSDVTNSLDRVAYYAKNGILYKTTFLASGVSSTEQMTANDVTIKSLFFYVEGAQTSDGSNDDSGLQDYQQPSVTFLLSGMTRPTKSLAASTTFNFEITVSPRELDNQ